MHMGMAISRLRLSAYVINIGIAPGVFLVSFIADQLGPVPRLGHRLD